MINYSKNTMINLKDINNLKKVKDNYLQVMDDNEVANIDLRNWSVLYIKELINKNDDTSKFDVFYCLSLVAIPNIYLKTKQGSWVFDFNISLIPINNYSIQILVSPECPDYIKFSNLNDIPEITEPIDAIIEYIKDETIGGELPYDRLVLENTRVDSDPAFCNPFLVSKTTNNLNDSSPYKVDTNIIWDTKINTLGNMNGYSSICNNYNDLNDSTKTTTTTD